MLGWIGRRLARNLIERAMRTPYSHLQRENGQWYMRRYWLVPYNYIPSFGPIGCGWVGWDRPIARILQHLDVAIRVHHIMEPDMGRHLHDHPWHWISVVLAGGYEEATPRYQSLECAFFNQDAEPCHYRWRDTGSVCLRRPGDRHTVARLSEHGAWTLFITFKKRQEWGFYTSDGKIHHTEYHGSAHIAPGEDFDVANGA